MDEYQLSKRFQKVLTQNEVGHMFVCKLHAADRLEDTDLTYNLQCGKWMEVAYEYHDDALSKGNDKLILTALFWQRNSILIFLTLPCHGRPYAMLS